MSKYASQYAHFFQTLSQETKFEEYRRFFNENSYFEDPFQKVRGIEAIYHIFEDMYDSFDNPRFEVIEVVGENNICYIQWNFYYQLNKRAEVNSFVGVSRVCFDEDGVVTSHIDYWDAGVNVYEKIPLLGSVIRFIKRKIHA